MEKNKQLVRRFFDEVWNQRKLEVTDELFDNECHTFQLKSGAPATPTPRGPEHIKNHITEWLSGFPDLHFTVEQMIAEGDSVSTLVAMDGTHTGEWMGIPPTGNHMNIRLMVIHRLNNSKIVEDRVIIESFGVFQQLGILPAAEDLLREFRLKKE